MSSSRIRVHDITRSVMDTYLSTPRDAYQHCKPKLRVLGRQVTAHVSLERVICWHTVQSKKTLAS